VISDSPYTHRQRKHIGVGYAGRKCHVLDCDFFSNALADKPTADKIVAKQDLNVLKLGIYTV